MNNSKPTHNHSQHEHAHSHNHHSHHHHKHDHSSEKNILLAFVLNFTFIFIEIAGGIITNSYAILSDAIHDMGDCIAIGLAYFFERLSNKKPDEKYTYGYKRFSLFSAVITSLILIMGSVIIILGSIQRLNKPEIIKSTPMLIIALFGLVVNGLAALKTSHSANANEKAINLHMLEDVLGWLTVLVGSLFIHFFQWYFIDTILSFVISVFLLFHSVRNILSTVNILLEKTPLDFDIKEYSQHISNINGVENVHHLHVWNLDEEHIVATLHIKIADEFFPEKYSEVKGAVTEASHEYGINHITVQVDTASCSCDNHCETY